MLWITGVIKRCVITDGITFLPDKMSSGSKQDIYYEGILFLPFLTRGKIEISYEMSKGIVPSDKFKFNHQNCQKSKFVIPFSFSLIKIIYFYFFSAQLNHNITLSNLISPRRTSNQTNILKRILICPLISHSS